jgi:TPR repeat protein
VLKSPDACINVAFMYRGGFGVEKSRSQEKHFYKKACEFKSDAGCTMFRKMDNKDKGIEEPSLWTKFKGLF